MPSEYQKAEMRRREEVVLAAGRKLADELGRLSLGQLTTETGFQRSTVHDIRERLRSEDRWPWVDYPRGWNDRTRAGHERAMTEARRSNLANRGLCGCATAMSRERFESEKVEVERARAELIAAEVGHLRRDDHDDESRPWGFGHAPPLLGGPTREYWFGQSSRYWQDVKRDPILSLPPAEACRLMIREMRRLGWLQRNKRRRDYQVA